LQCSRKSEKKQTNDGDSRTVNPRKGKIQNTFASALCGILEGHERSDDEEGREDEGEGEDIIEEAGAVRELPELREAEEAD
jgi:hypothetical protein